MTLLRKFITCWYWVNVTAYQSFMGVSLLKTMLKSMFVDKGVLTWFMLGWQEPRLKHSCPITWTFPSKSSFKVSVSYLSPPGPVFQNMGQQMSAPGSSMGKALGMDPKIGGSSPPLASEKWMLLLAHSWYFDISNVNLQTKISSTRPQLGHHFVSRYPTQISGQNAVFKVRYTLLEIAFVLENFEHVFTDQPSWNRHRDPEQYCGTYSCPYSCMACDCSSADEVALNRTISQIPRSICQISHNAPICHRNIHTTNPTMR